MGTDLFMYMRSEMSLTGIIFLLLAIKIFGKEDKVSIQLMLVNVLLLLNVFVGLFFKADGQLFNGMFYTNSTLALEKGILNIGTLLVSLMAYDWLKNHKHVLEFYILLLTTLLGMDFMISSANFLMFFLGLELSSIPLAAMVNMDLEKRKSSEGAMKMILSSAFASSITLFGISMLYGTTGTLDFKTMAPLITGTNLQLLAFIFVFVGFAFKLSSVPFHLWTADVYEGAPVPVTSYLSVISKGSIVFIFITVLYTLFSSLQGLWTNMLYLSLVLTITIGNLFAIRQNNLKRFLAFSSIAQVGYILLGISSGTALGLSSSIFFLLVYTFSNLGAFGVIAVVSAHTGKEDISDYKGFYATNPVLSWVLTICLFSLAGIPPTAGFFGKMFLLTAGAAKGNWALIIIAAMNMVISLYYYLRVVRAIFMEKNEHPIATVKGSNALKLALAICVVGVVVLGFAGNLFQNINTIIAK